MTKRRRIRYKKERVLVSDVLPFELPTTFTNHNFYKFLQNYQKGKIKNIPDIIKRIFFEKEDEYTVPYHFKIRNKKLKPRTLCVIHPKNQISVSEFYDKYKDLILYYGNNSNYSLRNIHKVSTLENFDDFITKEKIAEPDRHEESGKEYYSTSSFFSYKKFSFIYRFFENSIFYSAEKRFNRMVQLDISKCFDSIYTHSLSWALLDKDTAKMLHAGRKLSGSFIDDFDRLMQRMNYNETNGIVIGPEFSRVFAEILLQGIDRKVEAKVEDLKMVNKVHYRIFRYIDDYFIFYNKEEQGAKVESILIKELSKFKLFINESKKIHYEKPIITTQTIAKQDLDELIDETFKFKINEEKGLLKIEYKSSCNSVKRQINSLLKKNSVDHRSIMNILASRVEKKIVSANTSLVNNKEKLTESIIEGYTKFVWNLLDVLFFYFSIQPKVNTTIRLSNIICTILRTIALIGDQNMEDLLHKKIHDEILFVIKKYIHNEDTFSMIEVLYLLINLKQLPRDYMLEEALLEELISLYKGKVDYLFLTTLIFYIKDDMAKYKKVKIKTIDLAFQKFKDNQEIDIYKDTEKVLLMLDLIGLKTVLTQKQKKDILNFFQPNITLPETIKVIDFVSNNQLFFTSWESYDHESELKAKKYKDVY